MNDWLLSLAGTAEGARIAVYFALLSAFAHAVFGALQKGRHDPWLTRGAIDLWLIIISAPVALLFVVWPSRELFFVLLGAMVIHFFYKLTMALAYERAAYTVVYPIVRGTGPLVTVIAASVIFAETYTALQWGGAVILSLAILALAWVNMVQDRLDPHVLIIGICWALLGGVLVAAYTVYDAYGIRLADDPLTFLAWFFFLTAFDFPVLAAWRYRRMNAPPDLAPLMLRGFIGAVIAWVSFGGVMVATLIGTVGEAAILRETSTVFAALIGWLFLRERVGWVRAGLMVMVAGGAVLVTLGKV